MSKQWGPPPRAEGTVNKHDMYLKDFFAFLETLSVRDALDVRQSHITEYRKYRKQYRNQFLKQDAPDTQNRYLACIKKFFAWLKREGEIVYDPASEIEFMKVPKRLPKQALTVREVKKIFSVIDTGTLLGYRNRTMLELFYSSGIRRKELRFLKVKNVDFEEGFLRVIGKGDHERVVPLGKAACRYLETYLKGVRPHLLGSYESDLVFFGRYGKAFTNPPLDKMLQGYVQKAKLTKPVTFHSFRRSCATGMIRNNANVMHVRQMLGHTSMEAIQSYIDLTIVDLKKAHQKTHPREKQANFFKA
jgi:integrase/recombinase XerD